MTMEVKGNVGNKNSNNMVVFTAGSWSFCKSAARVRREGCHVLLILTSYIYVKFLPFKNILLEHFQHFPVGILWKSLSGK